MSTESREQWTLGITGLCLALVLPIAVFTTRLYLNTDGDSAADCVSLTGTLEFQDQTQSMKDRHIPLLGRRTLSQWQGSSDWQRKPFIVRTSRAFRPGVLSTCFSRAIAYYHPNTTILVLEPEDIVDEGESTIEALESLIEQRDYWSTSPQLTIMLPFRGPRFRADTHLWQNFKTELLSTIDALGFSLIDPNTALEGGTNTINPDWYWPDGITPTEEAYRRVYSTLAQSIGISGL